MCQLPGEHAPPLFQGPLPSTAGCGQHVSVRAAPPPVRSTAIVWPLRPCASSGLPVPSQPAIADGRCRLPPRLPACCACRPKTPQSAACLSAWCPAALAGARHCLDACRGLGQVWGTPQQAHRRGPWGQGLCCRLLHGAASCSARQACVTPQQTHRLRGRGAVPAPHGCQGGLLGGLRVLHGALGGAQRGAEGSFLPLPLGPLQRSLIFRVPALPAHPAARCHSAQLDCSLRPVRQSVT